MKKPLAWIALALLGCAVGATLAAPADPPAAEPVAAPEAPADAEAEDESAADASEPSEAGTGAPAEPAGVPERPAAANPPRPSAPPPAPAPRSQDSAADRNPTPSEVVPATGAVRPVAEGEKGLRLNFRNAPLEMVLNYLSEAAGFIIILEADLRGRLDVWSNQPLDREEAVELLNRVLNKNGFAAIRDGRTLTIVSRDEAKKRDIPVRAGNDPQQIPKSEAIITQIIPVRFINAVQVARDLQPLFPSSATIAANEGGNAVVITDTQTNIRRVAEIIRALDTSIASVSTIRVFPLRYADAKALATVVRDLFASTDSGRGNQQQQQQFRGFRPPGFGGDQGGQQQNPGGNARVATPRVVAVADERSNSLVVSAPEDQMTLIADMVAEIDTNVDDITELRVFRLQYADPQETADLILGLFPDPTQNTQGNRGQVRFGGFGGGQTAANTTSTRLQKQTKVLAVADLRTQSVVVSAARDLMEQIATMVKELDADPSKKQKVFVYSVENTDPQAVEEILRGLFEGQNARNRSLNTTRNNQRQTGNQLNNRANNTSRNQGTRTTTGLGGNTGR
jgi:type II secretory pathway component GspD/PulD (secretin)